MGRRRNPSKNLRLNKTQSKQRARQGWVDGGKNKSLHLTLYLEKEEHIFKEQTRISFLDSYKCKLQMFPKLFREIALYNSKNVLQALQQ